MTPPDHLVALPGTPWHAWRDALLRATGFPAGGLDRFAVPAAAAAADAFLAGHAGRDAFDAVFGEAAAQSTRTACELAGDPLFREAVTWQNPGALVALDGLRKAGPEADVDAGNRRTRYRQRSREELVARYWQRYCSKNESVGFFGPVAWVTMAEDGPAAQVKAGGGLTRSRRVWFERWALAAYAARLGEDPDLRTQLPVRLKAPLSLDGTEVLRPAQPPLTLTTTEAAALARCDGRSAARVAADLVADGTTTLRGLADGYLLLDRLVERGLLSWGIELPVDPDAEDVLARTLYGIEDEALRRPVLAEFESLRAARDDVAAAAGDPDRLAAALSTLDERFVAAAGVPERQRQGQMYAGRALCFEDTVRDLDVVFGGPVLAALAAPMELLLRSVRWLSARIATVYRAALRELYEDLAAELGTRTIPAGPLWYLVQGPLFGSVERPADAVTAEFVRRWAKVFDADPALAQVSFTSTDLADAVAEQFPAARPGWSGARLHSPDLTVCAESVDALNQGEFSVVLGELHAAWSTFNCGVFVVAHEEPERLRAALRADLGTGRSLLLYPPDFPRLTGRIARFLDDDDDSLLAFTDAPRAERGKVLPVTALTVSDVDGELIAATADGRSWPLIELFGELVAMHAVDAFKLVAAAAHTPRVSIDRLVVSRETWRCTIAESGLAGVTGYAEQFLAARRWRDALGLPERVFVKVATETKPVYLDFTAPRYVSAFCAMVRAAGSVDGTDVVLTVTEMLPTPDQAWVPDAEGNRYFSELRLQLRDPEHAGGGADA